MKKLKLFTALTMNDAQKLIGGFSIAYTANDDYQEQVGANNCKGGNCAAATCKSQKPKKAKGSNSNCVGNCVTGCGTKK
jgi:hypothetical protein